MKLTKPQKQKIDSLWKATIKTAIPVALITDKENTAVALDIKEHKTFSDEVAKYLNAILITYSEFGGKPFIITDEPVKRFDQNFKEINWKSQAAELWGRAKEQNRHIVVFYNYGLFNYKISIY